MYKLNMDLTDDEKNVLVKCAGNDYEILSFVEGESFVLSENGNYLYNECFEMTDVEFFARQKYEKIIPFRIIKFYQYYLMNTEEERAIWYRGHKDTNGNWEYDCYSDSLEEAFMSL